MDGNGASLEATHELILHYEVINNERKVSVLVVTGLFIPDLNCILLSPQYHLMDIQILKNPEGSFTVTWYKSVINISDQVPIIINYEQTNQLLIVHAYNSIYRTA